MKQMRTIQRDIAGAILLSNDDHILLCKSYQGGAYADFWIIPGGGIDEGETSRDAAIRETFEEVGIDVSGYDITKLQHDATDTRQKTLRETGETVLVEMVFHTFVVAIPKPAAEIATQHGDDIIEAAWHPLATLGGLSIPPTTLAALHEAHLL